LTNSVTFLQHYKKIKIKLAEGVDKLSSIVYSVYMMRNKTLTYINIRKII